MSSNLELKDNRVPSFIPYDSDPVNKKVVKRKRETKAENKPNKKVVTKKKTGDKITKNKSTASQIWVGAIMDETNGAFGIYFGENDERNYSETYVKDAGNQQDLDYAYVLGTLKAIEIVKAIEYPFIVNTSCRDLPRAITGKGSFLNYEGLVDKIRDLIKERDQEVQVRHISGRKAPEEQKVAINLASEALTNHYKQCQEANKNEDKSEEDIIMTSALDVNTDAVAVAVESPVLIDENKNTIADSKEEEQVNDDNSKEEEMIENTHVPETTIDESASIKEEAENSDTTTKEEDQVSSSWLSSFSLKNIFNMLSSQFNRNRTSSS
ncbi:uncharacterized protein BX663DRAFT_503752 [Cokeromyces recurvatus]|uniref:uncharacterized protein n=1 Tax=Cokeromyces recurvatus TaxID=90255 RepID=UPI00222071D4|nr:uncharacterized protein BX663DRAFT_503752 [Cokeromyces recurvatus]KAI7904840.1 hypothetical protein BX663DRAFT_503752 [Cokeromyces recurvatus]